MPNDKPLDSYYLKNGKKKEYFMDKYWGGKNWASKRNICVGGTLFLWGT
jgi:hypothetical protein